MLTPEVGQASATNIRTSTILYLELASPSPLSICSRWGSSHRTVIPHTVRTGQPHLSAVLEYGETFLAAGNPESPRDLHTPRGTPLRRQTYQRSCSACKYARECPFVDWLLCAKYGVRGLLDCCGGISDHVSGSEDVSSTSPCARPAHMLWPAIGVFLRTWLESFSYLHGSIPLRDRADAQFS